MMFEESVFIGKLLDCAIFFAIHASKRRMIASPGEFGLRGDTLNDPIAIARAMMVDETTNDLVTDYPVRQLDTYEELLIRWRGKNHMGIKFDSSLQVYPDLCVETSDSIVVCLAEMVYGMNLDEIRARMDRLLRVSLSSLRQSSRLETIVAVVFVHEMERGELIRDTEKRLNEWIGENFGPFTKRTPMPMMPRLTRSCIREAVNPIYRSLLTNHRRGQYVSFCISYSTMRP